MRLPSTTVKESLHTFAFLLPCVYILEEKEKLPKKLAPQQADMADRQTWGSVKEAQESPTLLGVEKRKKAGCPASPSTSPSERRHVTCAHEHACLWLCVYSMASCGLVWQHVCTVEKHQARQKIS